MLYKVGDVVKILPTEKLINHPRIDDDGHMARKWGGQTMTIRYVRENPGFLLPYKMHEDLTEHFNDGWNWSDDMIEGLVETQNIQTEDLINFLAE